VLPAQAAACWLQQELPGGKPERVRR